MLLVTHYAKDGSASRWSVHDLPFLLEQDGTTWVELTDPSDEEFEAVNAVFKWHPLAIEDLRVESHLPKVDDFGEYLLVVMHAFTFDPDVRLDHVEFEMFVGRTWFVTHSQEPVAAVDQLRERCTRNPALAAQGPAFLLYLLLEGLTEVYLPYLEELDRRLDAIEEQILQQPTPETVGHIYAMKRDVISLRRSVLPQGDVVRRLGRREFAILPEQSAVYFRDIYDELFRITEEANSYRELLTGALDAYLSAAANQMNQVMKVLTIFASIMLPLTFLAGVWGMNFEQMPELRWPYGYPSALGMMAAVAVGLALFFRSKHWL